MALFGKKKTAEKTTKSSATIVVPHADASVIVRPTITEKAAVLSDKNVYAFEIAKDATKRDVRFAVEKLWNVTPIKINIVNRAPRSYMSRARNRMRTIPGSKKAYVYLKKDDRIELV
jgi:large subunit ribosomal protein L23